MGLFKPRSGIQRTIAEQLQVRMSEIKQLFPGAKLTLVVRTERLTDPVIVTNDQPDLAIAAIRQMTDRRDKVMVAE